jgi:class 3 adenylate cyclase
MQRKLTAILSADVVGYSGLMEADETGTVERLKANRNTVFDPHVATHGGRVFKLMGDGALVEFSSVIAAVNCALAIQEATESDGTETLKKRIRYRIGNQSGEVIAEATTYRRRGQRGCEAPGPCPSRRCSPVPCRPGSSRRQGPVCV